MPLSLNVHYLGSEEMGTNSYINKHIKRINKKR